MSEYIVKLPDVGEGVAEAELVTWFVEVGDQVKAEDRLAEVVTDKVSIELPSPVAGTVVSLNGTPGELLAVGSELVVLQTGNGESPASSEPVPTRLPPEVEVDLQTAGEFLAPKPISTPPVRRRAKEAGIDLTTIEGTGPEGRITHADLDRALQPDASDGLVTEVPVVGVRRAIATQMSKSKSHIPHITYVEEVDVTELQKLRQTLNEESAESLSILPFIMLAVVRAIADYPAMNARYDDERNVILQHGDIDLGVATQTDSGLTVPVVRKAQRKDLWDLDAEMKRVTSAAKSGSAQLADMGGSTISITSLGALGGVVSTPVINYPEVAIIGVNKIATRPMWNGTQFVPREMMNLSSAFDHRVVDGYDAAVFIQRIKQLLEQPALLFI